MKISQAQRKAVLGMREGKSLSSLIMSLKTINVLKRLGLVIQIKKGGEFELTDLGETIEL